jgi:hypothetical protein
LEETIEVEALVDNPLVEGQDMVLALPICVEAIMKYDVEAGF